MGIAAPSLFGLAGGERAMAMLAILTAGVALAAFHLAVARHLGRGLARGARQRDGGRVGRHQPAGVKTVAFALSAARAGAGGRPVRAAVGLRHAAHLRFRPVHPVRAGGGDRRGRLDRWPVDRRHRCRRCCQRCWRAWRNIGCCSSVRCCWWCCGWRRTAPWACWRRALRRRGAAPRRAQRRRDRPRPRRRCARGRGWPRGEA